MWLSEKAATRKNAPPPAEVGTATGGASVFTETEKRNLPVCAPGGYAWRPKFGDDVLVIKCADGASRVISALSNPQETLESGEVLIYSGGASIHLKNDGRVLICGEVYINGVPLSDAGNDDHGT
jgi:hypothetical protein